MSSIKENVFTKDIFFEGERNKLSAVDEKKVYKRKVDVDPTELPSKNWGASRGSSQKPIGNDWKYKGDVEVSPELSIDELLDYFETLPYQIPSMDLVLAEKLELWSPGCKDSREIARKIISMVKWEREELTKYLQEWKCQVELTVA